MTNAATRPCHDEPMGDERAEERADGLYDYGTVLWRGEPDAAALFTAADAFWVPFSLGCIAFFAVATRSVVDHGVPWPALILVGFFWALLLYLAVGRFFVKRALADRTTYVVTDRFAIVERGGSVESRAIDRGAIRVRRRLAGRIEADFDADVEGRRSAVGLIYEMYRNTGMDVMATVATGGWAPLRFYDVRDRAGLFEALRAAGVDLVDRGAPRG